MQHTHTHTHTQKRTNPHKLVTLNVHEILHRQIKFFRVSNNIYRIVGKFGELIDRPIDY